jgi:hypothetical protein
MDIFLVLAFSALLIPIPRVGRSITSYLLFLLAIASTIFSGSILLGNPEGDLLSGWLYLLIAAALFWRAYRLRKQTYLKISSRSKSER